MRISIAGTLVIGGTTCEKAKASTDGPMVTGIVVNTTKANLGEYSSTKGDRYIGDFANGNFHGQGQFTFGTTNRTGDKYEGDFYKGEFHGNGTYFYANGDRFVGSFRFGKKNGRGVLYTHDGETIPGRWRNDKLVAELYIYPATGSIGLGDEVNPEIRIDENGIELEESSTESNPENVTDIIPPGN